MQMSLPAIQSVYPNTMNITVVDNDAIVVEIFGHSVLFKHCMHTFNKLISWTVGL